LGALLRVIEYTRVCMQLCGRVDRKTSKSVLTPRVSPRIERGKKGEAQGKDTGNRAKVSQSRAKFLLAGPMNSTQNRFLLFSQHIMLKNPQNDQSSRFSKYLLPFSKTNVTEWLQPDMKSRDISTDSPLHQERPPTTTTTTRMVEHYHCEPITRWYNHSNEKSHKTMCEGR